MPVDRECALQPKALVLVVLLGLGLAACAPSGGTPGSGATSSATATASTAPTPLAPSPSARPTIALEELVEGSTAVTFKASDGAELSGRLFGHGDVGIVLSHMGDPDNDQADWFWFAGLLADRGYRVLTYDRRGVCPRGLRGCSVGNAAYADHWKDVAGAVATLRTEGAARVVVIGASLGAADCLRAAQEEDSGIDGVVWIAGSISDFDQSEVADISIPVLVMAASGDPYGLFVDARTLDRWLTTSKSLVFPDSHLHGTDMLLPQADPVVSAGVLEEIVTFVKSIG